MIEKVRKNYVSLMERYKHSDNERLKIVDDWYDYMEILSDQRFDDVLGAYGDSTSEAIAEDLTRSKERRIRLREIEKRFEDMLRS